MRKRFNLTLQYWKDGDWFVGQIVEVPAAISQGATLAELQANIVDAYFLVTSELRRQSRQATFRPRHSRRRVRSKSIPLAVSA